VEWRSWLRCCSVRWLLSLMIRKMGRMPRRTSCCNTSTSLYLFRALTSEIAHPVEWNELISRSNQPIRLTRGIEAQNTSLLYAVWILGKTLNEGTTWKDQL
jgi:hypothetical protein